MQSTLRRIWPVAAVLAAVLAWSPETQAQSDDVFGGAANTPSKSAKFKDVVTKLEARIEPAVVKRGQTATFKVIVEVAPGWHTYPSKQVDDAPQVNEFLFPGIAPKIPASPGVVFVGDLKDPENGKVQSQLGADNPGQRSYEGQAIWERPIVVRPQAQPGETTVTVVARILVCNASNCLPPEKVELKAPLTISDAEPVAVEAKYQSALNAPPPSSVPAAPRSAPSTVPETSPGSLSPPQAVKEGDLKGIEAESTEQYKAGLQNILASLDRRKAEDTGLLGFILAGIFWGAVSLVTPCVFPMIPITVSYFLKQSEKEHHRPLSMALVYCGTITAVLTIAAVLLLSTLRSLSVNPLMNFGLGLLFIFFALSLFGMYEIELPSGLARFTSAREGQGGFIGTMFMALTFTILSFACVAPFLGGFAGTTATGGHNLLYTISGGLAFAATFAAPFFVLALFPVLLKKLPKSGTWLNSVKVVMGFLELAAALKFFRAGELVLRAQPSFFTYDFVLGIWIALSVLCGLYLLQVYRLPHDSPLESLSVPRLLFSALFLSLALYLVPALFKYSAGGEAQRPNGAIYSWVDSFLLPEPRESKSELVWGGNLKAALDATRARSGPATQRRLVFVDFTGVTCTNCKYNEDSIFSKPELRELFRSYQLVQLFTDKIPNKYYAPSVLAKLGTDTERQRDDAKEANLWFQREAFGTEQLPLYVILEALPNGRTAVVSMYSEGKINDAAAFAQFLKQPLETSDVTTAQVGGR